MLNHLQLGKLYNFYIFKINYDYINIILYKIIAIFNEEGYLIIFSNK